jgi:hypothetical protein
MTRPPFDQLSSERTCTCRHENYTISATSCGTVLVTKGALTIYLAGDIHQYGIAEITNISVSLPTDGPDGPEGPEGPEIVVSDGNNAFSINAELVFAQFPNS